ncbi:TetR/AcrR family transcriptional regulator [Gracilibacillus alcaliphilus]|uniref:TetR/AcrR family transcriptional regulator n=1 Tax=Gracilibacillus alcaliphilus TaxID=1401441 RepID=UPI0019597427|nr:TetR/AcrR family transcriptional regulator [Gracilibacillus alcaliphilus]MBM7675788.1 AcrR family transcriptional regulator [Gracilibacillus alcaliphilus]
MSKNDKRQRLMDAAYKVFSEKGYSNASIKDIANEADITPGLVHYYFNSKEELLFSVQESIQKQYHSQYEGQNKDPMKVLSEIESRVEKDPDWYRWRYELYSLGLKREVFNQEVAKILADGRESIARPLQNYIDDKEKAAAIASVLLACFDGLAYQKLMDSDFNLHSSYKVLHEFLESYIRS